MVLPLQDKLEDWKKSVNTLDKEHAKEYKKLRSDIKKKTENSLRVQKKNRKNKDPKSRKLVEQVGIIDFDLFSQLFFSVDKKSRSVHCMFERHSIYFVPQFTRILQSRILPAISMGKKCS